MLPLERIEFLEQQALALLSALPVADPRLQTRQQLHGELAQYWASTDDQGRSRRMRLADIHRAMMHAQLDLRSNDMTLERPHVATIATVLDLPYAWQRQQQPPAQRAQVYRPTLSRIRPAWRAAIPGVFVIVRGAPPGVRLEPAPTTGPALLCGLTQGIEAYASLAELHLELCERLDDPIQSQPLLHLLVDAPQLANAAQADRLRYEWYADDFLQEQVDCLIEAQRQRLNLAWAAIQPGTSGDSERLRAAMSLADDAGKRGILSTRYARLLEKNLPNWLASATPQALAHIMQGMQELVAVAERVAAPGILTLAQFQQRHTLQTWAKTQVEQRLRHDLGVTFAASDIVIDIAHTRQVGPHLNPLQPSSYVTWQGGERTGESLIETTSTRYSLDALAVHNLAWFDFDYWLTARVAHRQGKALPAQLTPDYVKALVRTLNVGDSYSAFLRTQLIDAPIGRWRLQAHARINRARMRAESIKARYAGHISKDWNERAYQWIQQVLDQPDNALRAPVDGHSVIVRQLLIKGHTVQGVLLIQSTSRNTTAFVLYTPDAPDRKAWRSFTSSYQLLRLLRREPAVQRYVALRLALLPAGETEPLLRKGRLGQVLSMPTIDGDLFFAYYMAEVHGLLATVDANSHTTLEVDVGQAINFSWYLVDLISLVLPARVLIPLVLGRMAVEIWSGVDAYRQEDVEGVLRHAYNALSHINDAGSSLANTRLMRRIMRGLPMQPPVPLPARYSVNPDIRHLRFRIDGLYGEGIYEKASAFEGLTQYFIQDDQGRYYKVSFDGSRWRVIDPDQPDAYLKQPVKRLADGRWVIDSPLLWYDGLPDLATLFSECRLPVPQAGTPVDNAEGLFQADEQLYLQTHGGQLPVSRHLLPGRYHLHIPHAQTAGVKPWATLRWQDGQWRIQVRQAGRSSDWLALPEAYSVSRGSNRSRR
ncbi:hypothetical protein IAE37_003038 [Pseudomonas sp. S31]|uniref:dermonecrotic toxin domain-containing protein n=1 Tax=Pseudomonas sp. S31 TaxID=1564473 RepID=UPI001913CF48|nr:DUF6543 domain-containing protein [Pseudomonas sp. S31]MBK5000762.1 hypothetical protein [Pseudomonas sp. S31]